MISREQVIVFYALWASSFAAQALAKQQLHRMHRLERPLWMDGPASIPLSITNILNSWAWIWVLAWGVWQLGWGVGLLIPVVAALVVPILIIPVSPALVAILFAPATLIGSIAAIWIRSEGR